MEASHDVSQQGAGSSCRAVNEVRAFQGPGRSRKRASALPCSSPGKPCSSILRCCTVTSSPNPCLHAEVHMTNASCSVRARLSSKGFRLQKLSFICLQLLRWAMLILGPWRPGLPGSTCQPESEPCG